MMPLPIENPEQFAQVLYAMLLAHDKPLSVTQLAELFTPEQIEPDSIRCALEHLAQSLENSPLELKQLASGYRLQLRRQYSVYINRLWEEQPQRYSRALLETLALIAYKQPTTRGEIEDVRGVMVSSHIIKTLQERDWIKIVGHKDVPGKPAMFATTKAFLDYFNLASLDELPPLKQVRDLSTVFVQLQENSQQQSDDQSTASDMSKQENITRLSFSNLLAELEAMETDLKTDFDDYSEIEATTEEKNLTNTKDPSELTVFPKILD